MDEIERGFFKWIEVVFFCIGFGNGGADENFSKKGLRSVTWKGDAVGGAGIVKIASVEPANSFLRDKVNGHFLAGNFVKLEKL